MIYKHKYKPRHYIPFIIKSKLTINKNSFLRWIYSILRRKIKPNGYFKYNRRRATNIKWRANRRKFNPANKSHLHFNNPYPNNRGYGRPIIFKRRYRENFYKKQQFRLFYGKFNEKSLRILIKNHKIKVSSQTSIFFVGIESRLDVIFFRRRIRPTIYSCHQFIHHFGLEVNNKLETCPQLQIKVGDLLTIPSTFWKSRFILYFARIYWRRWGIFIRGRRLIKKFKKFIFIFQPFNNNIHKPSQPSKTLIKSFDYYKKLFITYKKFNIQYKYSIKKENVVNSELYQWNKKITEIKINKLEIYQQLKLTTSLRKNFLPRIFRFIDQISVKGLAQNEQFQNKSDFNFQQKKIERLKIDTEKEKEEKANFEKKQNIFFHYKIAIIYRRKSFFRFKIKYLKKFTRKQRRIRKKNLHFFIPKYIQRDYRTLSILKVETQKESIIYFPFQLYLNKIYSFYRSKGF